MKIGLKLGTHSAPTPCLGQSRIRQKVATFTGAGLALGGVGLHWSHVQSQRSALLPQLYLFVFGECNLIEGTVLPSWSMTVKTIWQPGISGVTPPSPLIPNTDSSQRK